MKYFLTDDVLRDGRHLPPAGMPIYLKGIPLADSVFDALIFATGPLLCAVDGGILASKRAATDRMIAFSRFAAKVLYDRGDIDIQDDGGYEMYVVTGDEQYRHSAATAAYNAANQIASATSFNSEWVAAWQLLTDAALACMEVTDDRRCGFRSLYLARRMRRRLLSLPECEGERLRFADILGGVK